MYKTAIDAAAARGEHDIFSMYPNICHIICLMRK